MMRGRAPVIIMVWMGRDEDSLALYVWIAASEPEPF